MRDLSKRPDLISLNTATVRERWTLRQMVEGCVRHGFGGIAPWRDQVQAVGAATVGGWIRDAGLAVSGYCRGGMFTAGDEALRRAAIDDNRRAIEEAVALGARCLVILGGGLAPGSRDIEGAWRQVEDGLRAILTEARAAALPLAIEPLHPMYAADRCCISTLGHALDLCATLDPDGQGGVGVAIDVYHLWWDHELAAQVDRAGRERRIQAFHVCDWLVPTRDLLLDRGMMGDGAIDIPRIRGMVENAGYDGLIEVEIFSKEDWWQRDPDQVLEIIMERCRTVV